MVLTTCPAGYWEQRGWDADGIIRTESRFDVPLDHSQVRSPFSAAGVAWAGTRGVSRVEASTDDGRSWKGADLEQAIDMPSWRRWKITLKLPPGVYPLPFAPPMEPVEFRMPCTVLLTPLEQVDTTASWSQWWMGACYPSLLTANWYSYFS